MFSKTDYDKLQQIMNESPEKRDLISRLLASHQMTVSMISHEIRNPLTLVYSTLQLIESQHPETQTFRFWEDLKTDVEYMKLLLEDLSVYNNGDRLSPSNIDTNTFFKTLALSFASSLLDSDIQFVSKIDSALPILSGDEVKLKQVFLNLLTNARDALSLSSRNDCTSPTIYFSVIHNNNEIIVTVKDTGNGISEEQMKHIFEPFITYKKNGTGLGLALADKILSAHNGTIHVSSVPGTHTTFTATLPVKKHT